MDDCIPPPPKQPKRRNTTHRRHVTVQPEGVGAIAVTGYTPTVTVTYPDDPPDDRPPSDPWKWLGRLTNIIRLGEWIADHVPGWIDTVGDWMDKLPFRTRRPEPKPTL